ncbi:MAG: transglutaminase family protein, partial [Flavobacterium sp.]
MAVKIALSHKTTYTFDRSVKLFPHVFRLRPAAHSRTAIEGYTFKISPENYFINWQQDPFGNYQARIVFPDKIKELTVEVEVIAKLQVINPFDYFVEEYAEEFPFTYDPMLQQELTAYLNLSEESPVFLKFMEGLKLNKSLPTNDFLVSINQAVYKELSYNLRMEAGVQTPEETLRIKSGSCRDFAWLLIHVLRHFGLAARFVSGYIVQLAPDVKSLDGPSGPEKDFTDLHAWVEVYLPGAGWIGLDPTSGLFASEGHIPLCCTPHYE